MKFYQKHYIVRGNYFKCIHVNKEFFLNVTCNMEIQSRKIRLLSAYAQLQPNIMIDNITVSREINSNNLKQKYMSRNWFCILGTFSIIFQVWHNLSSMVYWHYCGRMRLVSRFGANETVQEPSIRCSKRKP